MAGPRRRKETKRFHYTRKWHKMWYWWWFKRRQTRLLVIQQDLAICNIRMYTIYCTYFGSRFFSGQTFERRFATFSFNSVYVFFLLFCFRWKLTGFAYTLRYVGDVCIMYSVHCTVIVSRVFYGSFCFLLFCYQTFLFLLYIRLRMTLT